MRTYLTLCAFISLSCTSISGQHIDLTAGIIYPQIHDATSGSRHYHATFDSKVGYHVGFGADFLKHRWFKPRLSIAYDRYGVDLRAQDGGLGGSAGSDVNVTKSQFSMEFYPICLHMDSIFEFDIGAAAAILVQDGFKGTQFWSVLDVNGNSVTMTKDIRKDYDRYNAPTSFGLRCRFAYHYYLNPTLKLTIHYMFHYGLTPEFIEFPDNVKTVRHYLGIGIGKVLLPQPKKPAPLRN
ncbi:MAG: hypothetical protein K9I85_10690 [Saprospiraceae bacterium]|nr:hypothetical protein [Saprospiraceae bacterium]